MRQASTEPVSGPRQLFARPDFRRVYLAGAAGQVGDAFQFVALLWYAVRLGGPLGVMVASDRDHSPALLFGLPGGLAADRWDRRRTLIAADLVRGVVLVPVAVAGVMFVAGGLAVFVRALGAAALVDLATRRYRAAATAA